MIFIDTHTHNYDEAFASDADAVIRNCVDAGVTALIQPDVDSSERDRMFELCDRHRGTLYPMLGLYPGSVDKGWREEIYKLEEYAGRGVVAIGEIGLDYHFSTEFVLEQKEAFRVQLEFASKMNLPVNIHLRDATEDFFRVMDDCKGLGLRGNLHAFSGSYETFQRLMKYGDWRIGVGGVVTFRNAALAEVVRKAPLERIVLETDSPYLTPVPFRGTRNDSTRIPLIAAKVAELKGITIEEVAEATTANAKSLFRI